MRRPVVYFRRSRRQRTCRPLAVVVRAINLTIVSSSRNGSPRQLEEMNEKRRCSTLFHLLVPGGKWHTIIDRPVWSAKPCNSHFHKRSRYPLLPPPSAVINNRVAAGYNRRPSRRHQPRMEATAKVAVS